MKNTGPIGCEVIPAALLEEMAEALRVLAHPCRLRIVEILETRGEAPVNALVGALGLPQASVSTHLGKMRHAGLIRAGRRGREIWYGIRNPHALTILNCIRRKAGMR